MYRTNRDLEESILRISGWFFYAVQNEIQWCSASQRSVYPVHRVDPFFSARSFHVFFHVLIGFVIGSLRLRGMRGI